MAKKVSTEDKNRRYYWLQLKEDFFEEDTMNWLEEQENGKDYVLFYLKMCVKSLRSDGALIRTIGETVIPYDEKALSKLTNTNIDIVRVALEVFQHIGLIKRLGTGEIFLTQINELVGNETIYAERKRRQRALKRHKGDNVPTLSGHLPREIEINKNINIEIHSSTSSDGEINEVSEIARTFEEEIGMITPIISEDVDFYLKELPKDIIIKAIHSASMRNAKSWIYVKAILERCIKENIKTIADYNTRTKSNDKELKKPPSNKKYDDIYKN